MKKHLLFCLLLISIPFASQAQATLETDTLHHVPYVCQADSFTVTVAGMHWNSGYLLDSVNHTYRNDSLMINIYYNFQTGFGVLSPFRLPLRFGTPQPALYTVYSKRFTNGMLVSQGTSKIGVCTSTTGLKNKIPQEISATIFPNPTTNLLHIELPEKAQSVKATLSDLTGKALLIRNFKPSEAKRLNVQNLQPGVYLLTLQTEQGQIIQKIVKN